MITDNELRIATDRLITGMLGRDYRGCEWYEGILWDAIDEIERLAP